MNFAFCTHPKVGGSAKSFTPGRSGLLQRKCACGQYMIAGVECEGCRKQKQNLNRRAASSAEPTAVPPIVHEVLRSPGKPLDSATRAFMEPRFGHDFGRVRVHTDAKAAESARAVNALAYAVGPHVVLDSDRYAANSEVGRGLLAHELVHTIQQNGVSENGSIGPLMVSPADNSAEREAKHASEAVLTGHSPGSIAELASGPRHIQRQYSATMPEGSLQARQFDQLDAARRELKVFSNTLARKRLEGMQALIKYARALSGAAASLDTGLIEMVLNQWAEAHGLLIPNAPFGPQLPSKPQPSNPRLIDHPHLSADLSASVDVGAARNVDPGTYMLSVVLKNVGVNPRGDEEKAKENRPQIHRVNYALFTNPNILSIQVQPEDAHRAVVTAGLSILNVAFQRDGEDFIEFSGGVQGGATLPKKSWSVGAQAQIELHVTGRFSLTATASPNYSSTASEPDPGSIPLNRPDHGRGWRLTLISLGTTIHF